jgi:hypothetical protein
MIRKFFFKKKINFFKFSSNIVFEREQSRYGFDSAGEYIGHPCRYPGFKLYWLQFRCLGLFDPSGPSHRPIKTEVFSGLAASVRL